MLKEQENSLHKVLWKNRKLILKNLDERTQEQRIETWFRDISLCSKAGKTPLTGETGSMLINGI